MVGQVAKAYTFDTLINDGILNNDSYEENKMNLPDDFKEVILTGGNHSQFGSYGLQKGDGEAGISSEEQIQQTVKETVTWMNETK